ncbi:MAG: serine hydrolase domain-containing protein [Bacteroidota bacterium]
MKYTLLLLFLWMQIGCQIQERDTSEISNIEEELDNLFYSLTQNEDFNGTVLVATQKGIVYKKAYGYLDGNQKLPLNIDSQFGVGSIYKELPGLSIMMLQEQGKLSLDDRLAKYLLDLPKWSEQITIQNLLQYTGGLPKINWQTFKEINDEELFKALNGLETLEFTPGKDYLYTNYSPFLLSKVVEKITGLSYPRFVQENIFSPYEMNQSAFKKTLPYEDRTGMAIPFDDDFQEDMMPFTIASSIFLFVTTAEDLYKFLEALHDFKIVSKASMVTLAEKTSVKTENIQSSLGTLTIKDNTIIKHRHHGSSGNYEALMTRFQEEDITIILTTNRKKRNLSEINERIYKKLIEE